MDRLGKQLISPLVLSVERLLLEKTLFITFIPLLWSGL